MTAIMKPENIGCLHLKSILKNPENYDMRPDLARYFLKAFYTILWNKSSPTHHKLMLEVMAGRHEERAFLEVRTNEACVRAHAAPLIVPKRRITLPSVAEGSTASTFHEKGATEVF